jgi:hypothetical protein
MTGITDIPSLSSFLQTPFSGIKSFSPDGEAGHERHPSQTMERNTPKDQNNIFISHLHLPFALIVPPPGPFRYFQSYGRGLR